MGPIIPTIIIIFVIMVCTVYLIVCISPEESRLLASNEDRLRVISVFIIVIIAYTLLRYRISSLEIVTFISTLMSLVLGSKPQSSFFIVLVGVIIIVGMMCIHTWLLFVYRGSRL